MICNFYFYFFNFCPKKKVFLSFRWGIIFSNFMGFCFRTSKSEKNISYIKYQISHRFGKVCKWLNMYYSNISKVTTMCIWIILKNLVWTYRECIFYHFWAIMLCIHPFVSKTFCFLEFFCLWLYWTLCENGRI
jgi:hypothetical protein